MSSRAPSESAYQLLTSASEGDIDSYSELFSRYAGKLYNYAYYLTFSREDAQDITSESFMRVYDAIQGRDVSSFNLQAYLYKTARNLAFKSIERREREGLTMEEASEIPEPDAAADPQLVSLIGEQRASVLAVADSLTEEQQSALLLRELEGLPYDTIAQVLDSNPNAVGVLLSRARLRFREVYRMAQAQTTDIPDPCTALLPAFSRYIDSEASPEEVARIEEHLASCPICNANLESMREASVTYRSLVPVLPLAGLKLWGATKTAILAGKAAAVGAHSAASTATSGAGAASAGAAAPTAATAAAGATAAGTAAATTAAVATTGMAISTKIVAVVAAVIIAAGVGVGGYYGYKKVFKNPLEGYSLVSPRDGEQVTLEADAKGNVEVPIKLAQTGAGNSVSVLVDGEKATKSTTENGLYRWSTNQPGKHTIAVNTAGDSYEKAKTLGLFALAIKKVNYSMVFERNGDIWTAQLAKDFTLVPGSEKNLTSSPDTEACPSISPDGKTICFLTGSASGGVMGSAAYAEVNLMDSTGGSRRTLAGRQTNNSGFFPDTVFTVGYCSTSWSGDGKYVICNGAEGSDYASTAISKIDVVTGHKEIVDETTTGELAIAADGSEAETIPLHAPSGDDPTLSLAVGGGNGRILFNVNQGRFGDPVWAPDSTFFSVDNSLTNEIWFVDIAGNIIRRIPSSMGGYMLPDGTHFYSESNGTIYIWGTDDSTPRPITEGTNPSIALPR